MRIAWFTPLALNSAIGRFSVLVTEALAAAADVDLYVAGEEPTLSTFVKVVRYDPTDRGLRARLRTYDVAVFNLGNHEPFHGAILQVARTEPGIVILHDVFNHHLLAGYHASRADSYAPYLAEARRWYGEEGERFARAFLQRAENPDDYARFPLFEALLDRHVGAVAHTRSHAAAVERQCGIAAAAIFLAYQPPAADCPPRDALGVPRDKALIVSIGFVNANRRIDVVLRALAASGLRDRAVYRVVGPLGDVRYRAQLEALIRDLDLGACVSLLGYADDATLAAHLVHADICVNLRYPVTEGASASVIEQALLGKPIIVTDTGFYADFPDDTVVKMPPHDEVAALAQALSRLVADPAERREIGARAALWVGERATGEAYAAALLRFARRVLPDLRGARLRAHAADVFDRMRLQYDDELPWRVAETTRELFGDALTPSAALGPDRAQ